MAQGVPFNGRAADSPTIRPFTSVRESIRDSGNWSMQSPSKHSSVMSSSTTGIQLPSLGSSHTSPNGHLSVASNSSERSPFSTTFPNGISNGSAEHPASNLPQLNQQFDPPTQKRISNDFPPPEARRSSVDSRMNNLALASPLPSANASQTSLVSDLQRERGIPTETPRSNGFHVGTPRAVEKPFVTSLGRRVGGKTAPPINSNPRSQWPNPNAENPTKGFPYAFPDPELAARSPGSTEEDQTVAGQRSRRNSAGASSVTSSIFTNDSRLPAGQRRLDDGQPGPSEEGGQRSFFNDRSSTEFANHHHHQMHNRQLSDVMDDPDSPNGQTPYSRTPELRVSHKLAERKRRSEMKNLFEELRLKLPADGRVSKTSKWEILTKSIEYIKALEGSLNSQNKTLDMYRRDIDRLHFLENENQQLRHEVDRLAGHHPHVASKVNMHYHPPSGPPTANATPRPGLPSMSAPPPPGAMQGVQYSH
ncbi:MAG: hypothetical protein M1817_000734 [Caeruleum heppii]|nr:MAG: hypothetical protein M1817_000734 [Caeruleum heppii]